jgi:hypothetical protein
MSVQIEPNAAQLSDGDTMHCSVYVNLSTLLRGWYRKILIEMHGKRVAVYSISLRQLIDIAGAEHVQKNRRPRCLSMEQRLRTGFPPSQLARDREPNTDSKILPKRSGDAL